MLGSDGNKTCAGQRIWPGRIYFDSFEIARFFRKLENHLKAARFSDPVGLHQPHFLRPLRQIVE